MLGMEPGQEEAAQMHGSRARDGLERAHSLLPDGRAVGADEQLLRGGGQFRQSFDSQIFVQSRVFVDGFASLFFFPSH